MRRVGISTTLVLVAVLGLGMAACEHEKPKGPAERVGEKVDNATAEIKAKAKEAKKDIKEAADDAEDKLDD